MDAQQAFVGYDEGPLLFRPTYRYDLGTQRYDTSEKMRIPAWTGTSFINNSTHPIRAQEQELVDRVLYRGNKLDLTAYSRAELTSSDHRPGMDPPPPPCPMSLDCMCSRVEVEAKYGSL